jgi:hypothetical protein
MKYRRPVSNGELLNTYLALPLNAISEGYGTRLRPRCREAKRRKKAK